MVVIFKVLAISLIGCCVALIGGSEDNEADVPPHSSVNETSSIDNRLGLRDLREMETGFIPNTPPKPYQNIDHIKRHDGAVNSNLTPTAAAHHPTVKELVRISNPITEDQVYRTSDRRSHAVSPAIDYHPYLVNKQLGHYGGYTDYVTTVPHSRAWTRRRRIVKQHDKLPGAVQVKSLSLRKYMAPVYSRDESYGLLRAFLRGKLKVVMDENKVPKLQFTGREDDDLIGGDNTLFYKDLVDRNEKVDPFPVVAPSVAELCNKHLTPHCAYFRDEGCLHEDLRYPLAAIEEALLRDPLIVKKFSSSSDNDDEEDERRIREGPQRNYKNYTAKYDESHWDDYDGFLCPSRVEYARPKRLRNSQGHWRVIVNNGRQTKTPCSQTVRLETCIVKDGPCRLIPPCYKSSCSQIFTFHRLLSFDPCKPESGLFMDAYRLPSSCSCKM